jgi:hypothetical protein
VAHPTTIITTIQRPIRPIIVLVLMFIFIPDDLSQKLPQTSIAKAFWHGVRPNGQPEMSQTQGVRVLAHGHPPSAVVGRVTPCAPSSQIRTSLLANPAAGRGLTRPTVPSAGGASDSSPRWNRGSGQPATKAPAGAAENQPAQISFAPSGA